MGFSLNGVWQAEHSWVRNSDGQFLRDASTFLDKLSNNPSAAFPAAMDRYHLYVSGACPWAHRVLIVRMLFGLEEFLPVSEVSPLMRELGWVFDESHPDQLYNSQRLHEIYVKSLATYTGRVTVPVLFDTHREVIVNNESTDLVRMLNSVAPRTKNKDLNLYPDALAAQIDEWNERIYHAINNGVYKAGFATTQSAYQSAVNQLFTTLEALDQHLRDNRFVVGDQLTETDIRLFTTLVRFDAVYHGHFKCNIKKLKEMRGLLAFTRMLYHDFNFGSTFDLETTKRHYYASHRNINPTGIVPLGPEPLL